MKLEELHSKLKAHLKDQNEKWEHFIYSKQDGFYQGLDEINIKGSRSSEKRFKEYNLTKYLSKNKTALDIGSNCGFFSIFISKYVQHITGVEINPYLVAIANDTKQYLGIVNNTFISSTFEDFKANDKFDIIFSLANDSTIDDNTKFNFKEYVNKIKNLLNNDGILIFESQAIDAVVTKKFEPKLKVLNENFTIIEDRMVKSEYPIKVPERRFLIFRK